MQSLRYPKFVKKAFLSAQGFMKVRAFFDEFVNIHFEYIGIPNLPYGPFGTKETHACQVPCR